MATLQDAQAPYLTLTEQAAAPAAPGAGDQRIYTKTDGKLYRVDEGGIESEVGGGTGGGGGITPSRAQAYRAAALSIPASTITVIPFDTEDLDTDGFHSTTTNAERFTVPTGLGGTYRVSAQVGLSGVVGDNTKEVSLALYKNGASYAQSSWAPNPSMMTLFLDLLVPLADGEYVDLRVYANGGAANIMTTAGRRYCRLSLERVA